MKGSSDARTQKHPFAPERNLGYIHIELLITVLNTDRSVLTQSSVCVTKRSLPRTRISGNNWRSTQSYTWHTRSDTMSRVTVNRIADGQLKWLGQRHRD